MFCSRRMNRKINYVHERSLRLVYRDYVSTYTQLLRMDNSLSFHHRNIHNVAIGLFKVKKDLSPSFMKEIFVYDETKDKFNRPNVRLVNMGEQSLRSFRPVIWNTMLPQDVKSKPNLSQFKSALESWIPDNCHCKLCKTYVPGLGYVELFE